MCPVFSRRLCCAWRTSATPSRCGPCFGLRLANVLAEDRYPLRLAVSQPHLLPLRALWTCVLQSSLRCWPLRPRTSASPCARLSLFLTAQLLQHLQTSSSCAGSFKAPAVDSHFRTPTKITSERCHFRSLPNTQSNHFRTLSTQNAERVAKPGRKMITPNAPVKVCKT